MSTLSVPSTGFTTEDPAAIEAFLAARGVVFERWEASAKLADDASQEEVLAAYAHRLDPYMKAGGYTVADVVVLHPAVPNKDAIRAKFLSEHTHSEDEVRFFVDGKGLFYFHLEPSGSSEEVFSLLCEAGDLISVPKNTKHWFDCGPTPFVKAIRVFIDPAGWVPHYTASGAEARYPTLD